MRAAWALALAMVLGSCAPQPVERSLQDGFNSYSARQLDTAESIANAFITRHPDSPNIDQAYYLRGIARFTRGDRAGAFGDLRVAANRTTRPDLKSKAYRALGDIEFDDQHWSPAQGDYEQALAAGAAGLPAATGAYLEFHIGACLQALGQWDKARPYFARVITGKADAGLVDRAVSRLDLTNFQLQFGAFQDVANARDLASRLKADGVMPTISTDLHDGKPLYRVVAGSYKTWADANTAQDAMRSKQPVVAIVP